MAARGLLDGECGAPNAVVRLAKHVTRDQAFKQEVLHTVPHNQNLALLDRHQNVPLREDELVNEFLATNDMRTSVPQSFHMGKLLDEMHQIDQSLGAAANEEAQRTAWKWSHEFMSTCDSRWIDEFGAFDSNRAFEPRTFSLPDESAWARESLSETAANLLDQVNDKKFSNSEFMKFVETIKNRESSDLNDNQTSSNWVLEFENQSTTDIAKNATDSAIWDAQLNENIIQAQENNTDLDFWDQLQDEWEKMAKEDHVGDHPWLTDFKAMSDRVHEYKFEEDNPALQDPDPFESGLQKLKEGNLPAAILYFEAAAQRKPDHTEAWQYLGTTHAENEQDPEAIAALRRCLDLDPTNLTAWMAIAVSYTNESYQEQACHALSEWLRHHPKYSSLVTNSFSLPKSEVTSIMNKNLYDQILDLYLSAAQMDSSALDPDVQCGLGVLLNLSGDYDKAVDCFQAALRAKPKDALLWNRLGATLANSNRSEEAIGAYYNALQISPGFIRSRYNLGISCISLGAHREAVEHFLSALNSQWLSGEQSGQMRGQSKSSSAVSDNIWSTLRMVLSLMNRSDLNTAVDARDLHKLNQELAIK